LFVVLAVVVIHVIRLVCLEFRTQFVKVETQQNMA